MTPLTTLAARVEAASGADRTIDSAIHAALGLGVWTSEEWAEVEAEAEYPAPSIPEAARYTASLDAALSLVPEGAVWHVMTDYGDLNRAKVGPAGASIYREPDRPLFIQADAATPALALCAASLRARAAEVG